MIRHHPGDELLLSLAAGRLRAGLGVVVGAHLEGCATCRERLQMLEAVGGAMLERTEPQPMAADALASALQRISREETPAGPRRRAPAPSSPGLPPGLPWPASLGGCEAAPWRWMGAGRRISRITVPHDPQASVFLLRIDPGGAFPRHGHAQLELTQVLCGAFSDGRSVFGPGDFDSADEGVHHEPVVEAGSVCVCLTALEGPLTFDGRMAAAMARWLMG